mgnify:CR=1 FL=1
MFFEKITSFFSKPRAVGPIATSNEGDCHEQWGELLVAIYKNKRNKELEQRVLGKNSRPQKRKKEKRRLLLLRAL